MGSICEINVFFYNDKSIIKSFFSSLEPAIRGLSVYMVKMQNSVVDYFYGKGMRNSLDGEINGVSVKKKVVMKRHLFS